MSAFIITESYISLKDRIKAEMVHRALGGKIRGVEIKEAAGDENLEVLAHSLPQGFARIYISFARRPPVPRFIGLLGQKFVEEVCFPFQVLPEVIHQYSDVRADCILDRWIKLGELPRRIPVDPLYRLSRIPMVRPSRRNSSLANRTLLMRSLLSRT